MARRPDTLRRPTGRSWNNGPQLPDLRGAVDIGAGDGAFLERLRTAGFEETVGFEPSEAPLAAGTSERARFDPSRAVQRRRPPRRVVHVDQLHADDRARARSARGVPRRRTRARAPGSAAHRVSRSASLHGTRPQATFADLRHRTRPAILAPEHERPAPAGRARANRGAAIAQSLSAAVLAPAGPAPRERTRGSRACSRLGDSSTCQCGSESEILLRWATSLPRRIPLGLRLPANVEGSDPLMQRIVGT